MEKRTIRAPFFVVNPKAYLYGKKALELAKHADMLAEKYDIDVFFTGQAVDLPMLKRETKNLIITAQHIEGLKPGRGMGHVLADAMAEAGVEATFLNHAEHPMTTGELAKAIARCDELGIITIVCCDTVEEAKAIGSFKPDVMICEPTSLIGTGTVSDGNYMAQTNAAVREASPTTFVLQAAGISTGEDVYNAIMSGADASGATSGIVAAKDPIAALEDILAAVYRAKQEMQK